MIGDSARGNGADVAAKMGSKTHNPRVLVGWCDRNLDATIRATTLAKISRALRNFRIAGPVELRAADEAG